MRNETLRHDYAADLVAEIDAVAAILGSRRPVAHIHWGGGTPTALPAAALRVVDRAIRDRFRVLPGAEIAVEIDPRSLEADRIDALADMGTTRASLGVQDFEPAVQKAIGRKQDYSLTQHCVDRLRGIGIGSINLDLLYGLPHQTEQSARRTAQATMGLAPDRIAVFGYAHVPWMKRHQGLIGEHDLPDAEARHAQRDAIDAVLTAAGYQAIALDHSARPDDALAEAARCRTMGRNFQSYTADPAETLIGFGASAISTFREGYVQNRVATADYSRAVRATGRAAARGIATGLDDRLRRDVIATLMCGFDVDLAAIADGHGVDRDVFASDLTRLDALIADGIAEREGWTVRVTPAGRPFVRLVAAVFDTYLNAAPQRHSRAV